MNCPQCGFETETLTEGYCHDCWQDNQNSLFDHNHAYDAWEQMNESDKAEAIKNAARNY